MQNSHIVQFAQLLINTLQNNEEVLDNWAQFIQEYLYKIPTLLTVDNASLWLFNAENNVLTCQADYLHHQNHTSVPAAIEKSTNAELFTLLQSDSLLIAPSISQASLFSKCHEVFVQFLQLQSAIITPIVINGKSRGVVIFGNSQTKVQWPTDSILIASNLGLLFSRAIMHKEQKRLTTKLQSCQQLFQEVENVAKVGGWEYEIDTEKLTWTAAIYKIYAMSDRQVITPEIACEFYTKDGQELIYKTFRHALETLTPYQLELPFTDKLGQKKWVRTTGKVRINNGKATHLYGAFEDITHPKNLVNLQKIKDKNFDAIVDNLNECVIILNSEGVIQSVNRVIEETFGYTPEELLNKNISILMPEPHASMHQKYIEKYMQSRIPNIIGSGRELPAVRKDGSTFPIELCISEVINENKLTFIGIIRDITERKKAQEEIHHLAYFDEMTGLLNKNSFEKELKNCFEKSNLIDETFTILQIDIDKFSQINLTYGDEIGDYILNRTANRLNKCLPSWATVYRNNADSFYVLISSHIEQIYQAIDLTSATSIAQHILQTIKKPIRIGLNSIKVRASIGILETSAKIISFIDIKPLLELALSKAKLQGGNIYALAEKEETNALKRYSQLSFAMHDDNFVNELSLVIQPQYSAQGKVVGSEALVRWQSPELGFVPPDEFIPIAEKNGGIIKIGEWVLNKVCQVLTEKQKFSSDHTSISVNISAKQIAQPNFVKYVINCLDKYKLPHQSLLLELTETALVADLALVLDKMTYLKKEGVKFSIDDFGTGYSSLKYIQSLPISELKIDKSFVDDIQDSNQNVPIVSAIIQLAQSLELTVVAEGVETITQLNHLKNQGCEIFQGYYFSKPVSESDWLKLWLK